MKIDKKPPIAPAGQHPPLPLAGSKSKPWANVRRKFAQIVATRNSPAPDGQSAVSQAESFCRPFIQDSPEPKPRIPELELESDHRELEFEQLTKENSERNKEITSPSYSAPKTAPASGRSKKKKKKNQDKIVRFIEEPYTIPDQPDRCSIDATEAEVHG